MADGEHQLAHPEAPEFSLRGKRIRNPKLRRGIFLLPSMFTVGNLLCGYYACVAVATSMVGADHSGDPFDRAAKAIGLAMVFDALDGRVARLTGTNTEFGVQFDSLADVVTFGIAPSLLAVTWGVRNLPGLDSTQGIQQIAHLAGGSASLSQSAAPGDSRASTCKVWLLADRNISWGCRLLPRPA